MRGTAALVGALIFGALALAACSNASSTPPRSAPTVPSTTPSTAPSTTFSAGPPAPGLRAGEQTDVTYCNGQTARITEPARFSGAASPAVVYVHGGSWVSGNDRTGGFLISTIGPDLASKGFVVASLNYRLGPVRQWPDQIEDVKCAIRYLRANAQSLHIDPSAIGVWGQSAGGHLAALLGTAGTAAGWDVGPYANESSQVQAVVDMAGPSDFLTLGEQGDSILVQENFLSLLGGVPADKLAATLKAASPVTWIAPGDPPFLVMYSNNDEVVYPQQSQELQWDLTANGVPHQVVVVNGGGHEFDNSAESPNEAAITQDVVSFFTQTLVQHQPIGG